MNGVLIVAGDNKESKGMEVKLPLSALALDGVNPSEGDAVEVNIQGMVTRVQGDYGTVQVERVNGEALENVDGKEADQENDSEEARLLREAEKMDREAGGY